MNNEPFELQLTEMVHGGQALGKHDGRAIFVPFGIPGERILARIRLDKGRYAFAEVVSALDASEERVTPPCPYFGRCGGCHWQHIAYEAQLQYKRQVVSEQMRRLGGLPDTPVSPTLPSPDQWYYRSHITLHRAPGGQPGFVAIDDQTVIPIETCHIIRPELLTLLNEAAGSGLMRHLQPDDSLRLQIGSDGNEYIIAVSSGKEKRQKRNTRKQRPAKERDREAGQSGRGGSRTAPTATLASDDTNTGDWEVLSPFDIVHYDILGQRFQVSAGSFFQVNLPQAAALVELVLARLALTGKERVLDLYSGVGLFTAFLAAQASQVTAVEVYAPAVKDAQANLAEMDNVRLVGGAIETTLAGLKGPYQAAVVDPPRAGMHPKALDALVRHAPAKIVYVSCDPATLARDAKLLAAAGYSVVNAQPVDMFPQTFHVEAVAAFVRA